MKCIGCGITLQNKFKDKLGYTPKLDNKYCERCFKTIHYNKETKIDNFDNYKLITKINKLNLYTFFMTDYLNLNNEVLDLYNSINNKKILVINKMDLIPSNIKIEHIIDNIKNNLNIDVIFISAKYKDGLNKLINLIEENKSVIFCGATSSGKSTIINNLIDSNLTVSKYNNTTLDFIKLKYHEYIIYDTPGFLFNSSNIEKIDVVLKQLNNDYVLNINDYKFRFNGNVTIYINDKNLVKTKKEDIKLNKININDNIDILIPNGFIFIKKGYLIESNKDLVIRKSIIGG